jgi:hypothetical protein
MAETSGFCSPARLALAPRRAHHHARELVRGVKTNEAGGTHARMRVVCVTAGVITRLWRLTRMVAALQPLHLPLSPCPSTRLLPLLGPLSRLP